jgi:hypothetical protein
VRPGVPPSAPNAVDRGERRANLVVAQQPFDVALEGADAAPEDVEILADIADLEPIRLAPW